MKNSFYLAAVLLGILLLVAVPVSAETLTGNLGTGIPTYSSTPYSYLSVTYQSYGFHNFSIRHVENQFGFTSLIRYDTAIANTPTFDTGAPAGTSTPYVASDKATGTVLFSGTFGYQRIYNYLGVEQPGYQYLTINNYDVNLLGKTGRYDIIIDYSDVAMKHIALPVYSAGSDISEEIGGPIWYYSGNSHVAAGSYVEGKTLSFQNLYSVVSPSGLGIAGTITKNNNPSQAFIYNGITGALISSQNTVLNSDFNFQTLILPIILGAKSSSGNYYNSSILFPIVTNYTISVSPTSGKKNDTFTGTLSPSTGITAVRWYAIYPGQSSPSDFYDATSTPSSQKNLNYALIGGNWMGWDTGTGGFTNNKGATLPNPVSLIPRYSGTILVGCYVYLSDGTMQNPTTTITVGDGQSLQSITFHAEDALTGNHVSPTVFNIKQLSTNIWLNQTSIRPGQIDVQYPTGTTLYLEAVPPTGSGYSLGTLTYQVLDTTGYTQNKVVQLWKNSSTNLSVTTANLIVNKNSDFSPIKGASITLSDGQICTTSDAGACQIQLNNGTTTYYATIRATGYQTNQFYFLPTGASYSKAFQMVAIGATQTPYITVPVSGTVTPAGITTLNPTTRTQAVSNAGDIWFNGAVGLSALIFIAVLWNVIGKIKFGKKK